MKTAVLHGLRDLRVEEQPVPQIGSDDVLLEVHACGVCGTDVHIYNGDKGAADNPLPLIPGHEFSGTVVEAGSRVTGFAPGDRVCADPNVLCGACDSCRNGAGHFCTRMEGIGTTRAGGFAQFCAVPQSQLYRLADDVTFAEGAMAEPLSCCLHGIDQCGIRPGSTAAVIGCGMIGLLMLQLARSSGAARIIAIEPSAAKRELAAGLGADVCIDPGAEDVKAALAGAGVTQIDTVIECVGSPRTIAQAVDIAGRCSTVMMFGLTKPEEETAIRPYEIFKKEVVLKASYINPYTMGRAVSLINHHKVDVSSMTAEIVPLEKLGEVLADDSMRGRGKFIVDPWA